jgi:hypothetical protein
MSIEQLIEIYREEIKKLVPIAMSSKDLKTKEEANRKISDIQMKIIALDKQKSR